MTPETLLEDPPHDKLGANGCADRMPAGGTPLTRRSWALSSKAGPGVQLAKLLAPHTRRRRHCGAGGRGRPFSLPV